MKRFLRVLCASVVMTMALVSAPPNMDRPGVVAGFTLSLGAGLTPTITRGVLFAQTALYRPANAPTLPAAPASDQSWLWYNSSTGFYWSATFAPATAGDAGLGWVATNATDVIAVSAQQIEVPDTGAAAVTGIDIGYVLPPSGLDESLPPPVTGQSASEGPDFADDGAVQSRITVAFTPPDPLENWGCCEIWKAVLTGPAGTLLENPVLVAELVTSPASWFWRPNGEWVRLYFVSLNTGGRRADILTSPTAEVQLDGQASAPVPVSGFGGVADGQQVRLSWHENLEADIDHYDIARRDSAGPPAETEIIARVIAAGSYTAP